jgi:hypothetical protein
MIFLVVSDINVHQLNLRPLRSLQFWLKIHSKNVFFFHFLNNKCIVNSYFWDKSITLRKRGRFYMWALYYFFNFFWFGNMS